MVWFQFYEGGCRAHLKTSWEAARALQIEGSMGAGRGSLLSAVLETSRMEKSRKEGTEIRGCLGLGGGRNGEFLLKVKGFPFK